MSGSPRRLLPAVIPRGGDRGDVPLRRRTSSHTRKPAEWQSDSYLGEGLSRLQRQVASELRRLQRESAGLDPKDVAVLELYRESFKRLIPAFKTFGPVLTQIKSFFDAALDSRMRDVDQMHLKVVNLQALMNGYDLNLQAIHDKHDANIKPYAEDLAKVRKINAQMDRKIAEKQAEVDSQAAQLKKVKVQLGDLEGWQMTLVKSMKRWEGKLNGLTEAADKSEHSVWRTKQEIKKKASQRVFAEQLLLLKQQTHQAKDKELKIAITAIIDLHARVQEQRGANKVTEAQLEEMVAKLKRHEKFLEEQKNIAVDRSRNVTPRPDWQEVEAYIQEKRIRLGGQLVNL